MHEKATTEHLAISIPFETRLQQMVTLIWSVPYKQKALDNNRVADYLVKPFSMADAHAIADKLDSWDLDITGS